MIMFTSYRFLIREFTVGTSFVVAAHCCAAQSLSVQDRVADVARMQRGSEAFLSRLTEGGDWARADVQIQEFRHIGSVVLWRAAVDYKNYIVVQIADTLLRGGGFASPDLVGIDASLQRQLPCSRDLRARAQCLALAADPFASVEIDRVDGGAIDHGLPAVRRAWISIRPTDWPVDTILGAGRDSIVVITMLSHNKTNFEMPWLAIAHAFSFRGDRLQGWSSRSSAPIPQH